MLRNKAILAALDAAASVLFQDPARVVWVGGSPRAGGLSTPVPEQLAALSQRVEGAVWQVEGDLRAGLFAMRPFLNPGARLLLSVRLVPSAWRRLGAHMGRRAPERRSRESVCEALLLSGLLEPRVWMDHPQHLCISAELPKKTDPLDDVFTQPVAVLAR